MANDFGLELLNCPYCGNAHVKPDRLEDNGEWCVLIRCFRCMTGGPYSPFYRTIPDPWAKAAEKWNAMVKGTGPVKRKRKAAGTNGK